MTTTTQALDIKNIALLGNPNAGKSSLFNALTGLNQKIGNYSGVTIDKNTGTWKLSDDKAVDLIDLPGIYSLFAKSPDERVVLDPLFNIESKDRPDLILLVLDASNLTRSLLLLDQDSISPFWICIFEPIGDSNVKSSIYCVSGEEKPD